MYRATTGLSFVPLGRFMKLDDVAVWIPNKHENRSVRQLHRLGDGDLMIDQVPLNGFQVIDLKCDVGDTYLTSEQPLELTLQLLDIRRDGPTKLDEQMIEWLRETSTPHTFVLTKSDKLKHGRRLQAVSRFGELLQSHDDNPPIPYSAVSGEGKRELWSLIDRRLSEASRPPTSDPVSESVNTT